MPPGGEVIVFPDPVDAACAAVNAFLEAHEESARATGRVPSKRPRSFIRVRLVGGDLENLVTENYSLTLEAYASTATEALRLCVLARAIILAQDGDLWGCTSIASPTDLPDPTTEQERATSTVGVRVRGTAIA